jgi:predicted ABC-type ATPase
VNNQESFAFEHNFHTQSSYRYFDWIRKQGYQTRLLFLAIADVQICLDRVNERFVSGRGHFIDEPTIRQRYQDSLFNLKINLKRVDEVAIIDNTNLISPRPCLVFKNGSLVVTNDPPTWIIDHFKYYLPI